MLINIEDLPADLRKHVEPLREFVRQALRDFLAHHSAFRVRYSPRTQASIIHDYMVWFAKESKQYEWRLRRNLFLFKLENDYTVKPKKIRILDGKWRVSNIRTNLVLAFEQQRPIRLFDDLDLTHLYLGYQLDPVEVGNSTIWLVCPQGRGTKWAVELSADENAAVVNVGTFHPEPAPTPVRRVRRKVTPDATPRQEGHSERRMR